MKRSLQYIIASTIFFLGGADAGEVTIPLSAPIPVSRHSAKFQCDGHAGTVGLPSGIFKVEYLNWEGNSLAVLPIEGRSVVFAGITAGSGARYAAGKYIWWDAGSRGVHLYIDSPSGKEQASCQGLK